MAAKLTPPPPKVTDAIFNKWMFDWYKTITSYSIGNGAISTRDPTSGGAGQDWKLGAYKAATVALVTTHYVEVSINGVTYKLGVVA